MSLTQIGVVLTGIWIILTSQEPISSTLSLVFGVVIVALILLDSAFVRSYRSSRSE